MSRRPTKRKYRLGKRAEGAAETRARILEVARALFESHGFHGAALDAVAERAGVARVTVYEIFGSKRGLLEALAQETLLGAEFAALVAAMGTGDPREAVVETVRAGCRFWQAHERLVSCMHALAAYDDASAEVWRQRESGRSRMIHALVRRLARAGGLARGLPTSRAGQALVFLTSFGAFEALRESGPGPRAAEGELVRAVEALVLAPVRLTRRPGPRPR